MTSIFFSFVVINRNTLVMIANLHFSGFILALDSKEFFFNRNFLYFFESVESLAFESLDSLVLMLILTYYLFSQNFKQS